MSALLWFGYGSIALCLLTVALHDIGTWWSKREPRAWIYCVRMEYPRHLTYEDGP